MSEKKKKHFSAVTEACHELTKTVFQAQRCYNRGDLQEALVVLHGLLESTKALAQHIHNERLQKEAASPKEQAQ